MKHTLGMIAFYFFICLSSPVFALNPDDLSAKEYVIAELLTHDEAKHLTIAGKLLTQLNDHNEAITDMAAYQAWQYHDDYIDGGAWLIKAIGKSGNARYRSILNDIKKISQDRKTIKYTDLALKDIIGNSDTTFSVDTRQFELMRDRFLEQRPGAFFDKDHVDKIKVGDSLEHAFNTLGKPSRISIFRKLKKVKHKPFLGTFSQELHDFQLIYAFSGIIRFHLVDRRYLVSEIVNDPFYEYTVDKTLPQDGVSSRYQQLLTLTDPEETRILVKSLSRDREYRQSNLDIAAYKIWLEKDTENKYMIDAMAILTEHVGRSRNGRYRVFLTQLMEESTEPEIVAHARVALKYSYENIDDISQFLPFLVEK